MNNDILKQIQEYRRIQTPCQKCRGTGIHLYGSTATWRGGIGGRAMTNDVCNNCWGSGDEHRKGLDLRKLDSLARSVKALVKINEKDGTRPTVLLETAIKDLLKELRL